MNDFQEYFIHEFVTEYKQGHMSRRDMIRRVMYIMGGVASTATLLSAMGCGPGQQAGPTPAPATKAVEKPVAAASASPSPIATSAAVASPSPAAAASPSPSPAVARSPLSVPANDPSIDMADITFPGDGATIMAYQAKPKGDGPFPLVLVCHQNRGLDDHIRDVTRRLAKEGYVGCAVDLLSREGGTRSITDPARIPALLTGTAGQALPPERHVGDFQAALRFYATQPIVRNGAYGMTGFCFGGGIVWRTATKAPELKAAAPWYGAPPPLQDVPGIKAAVFGIYSSDPNDFANRGRDELEAALKQAGVAYQLKVYPGTMHAFNDDTNPSAYNQEQSGAAWKDMLDWFARYLKA